MKKAKILLTLTVIASSIAGAFATAIINKRIPPVVWFTHQGQTLSWLANPCTTGPWQCYTEVGTYGNKAIYRTTNASGQVTDPYPGLVQP
jgi:hypothetical protein